MEKELEILIKSRVLLLKVTENLTLDQVNTLPEGHRNNIAWNLAHLLVTQQLLCYTKSGLKTSLNQEFVDQFKKGSKTEFNIDLEMYTYIRESLLSFAEQTSVDFFQNKFKTYEAYTTSVGVSLNSIEDAIKFNNYHEGIHLGTVLAQRKMV